MVSTFGSLQTAYSGLSAARTGLDVTGQNIANAGTTGYTRQRVDQSAVVAPAQAGLLWSSTGGVGQGVSVDGIVRLANAALDAQVRTTAGVSGYADARATALSTLESGLNEPGANGLSSQLGAFWSAWSDLSNSPDDPAAAGVVISTGTTLASTLRSGSQSVATQWASARKDVADQVGQVNDTAAQVAALNRTIRDTLGSGGSANELIDQRDQLTERLASLTGATVRQNVDGTADVVLGGNALVAGTDARKLAVGGATAIADVVANPVTVSWADGGAGPVGLTSGSIAGTLSVIAPANGTGTGGALAEASASYDRVATALATTVNTAHEAGTTGSGATGTDFFAVATGVPAAQGLSVLPTDASGLAVKAGDGTGWSGGVADAISQLGGGAGSPDAAWATFVTGAGTASRSAATQSTLADLAATGAKTQQQSGSGVSLDEENVNLLTYQHAYQGAARVLTAVDEMLDTLINRVGLVGRS